MSDTGRYYIHDKVTGRKFWVEPVRPRNEKEDETVFTNGGIDTKAVKKKSLIRGGAVPESESVITAENGFKDIVTIGPGDSPESVVSWACRNSKNLTEVPKVSKSLMQED